jgi:hypothetical protein
MANDSAPHVSSSAPATPAMVPATAPHALAALRPEQLADLVVAADEALEHAQRTTPPTVSLVAGLALLIAAAGSAWHGSWVQAGVTIVGAASFIVPWARSTLRTRLELRALHDLVVEADAKRLMHATREARAALASVQHDDRRTALLAEVERRLQR